jgi:hypothetical protein
MYQFIASRQPSSSAQTLLMEKPRNEFKFLLPRLRIPHGHIHCVCGCMSAITNVTIDSQTIHFTCYLNRVSNGSDMHVVNSGKYSVACDTTDCEIINN